MDRRIWILEGMQEMPVIDTHEHLEAEADRIARNRDFIGLFMTHYASTDVMLAGMPAGQMAALQGDQLDVREKWTLLRPWWDLCRNTAYFQALLRASIDLYGITQVDDDTYLQLDAAVHAANQPGWYRQVLKDVCHIERCVLDDLFVEDCDAIRAPDPEFFREAAKYDHWIRIGDGVPEGSPLHRNKGTVSSLRAYVSLLGETVAAAKRDRGIVAIKSAIAYERTLAIESVPFRTAETLFDRVLRGDVLSAAECKPLQDWLLHALFGFAGDLALPVQIHTGLLEGIGGDLEAVRPTHLLSAFREHPGVRFDVFHTGYPYGAEVGAVAKMLPNVWVDLCWTHVISREYAVRMIEEYLEILPSNKILGFGGDYIFVEGTYAHLQFAKENIAEALAARIDKGRLDRSDALGLARRLLYENPKAFFGL